MWYPAPTICGRRSGSSTDAPYPNEEKETPYEGFTYEAIVPVDSPSIWQIRRISNPSSV